MKKMEQWELDQKKQQRSEEVFGFAMFVIFCGIFIGIFTIAVLLIWAACRIVFG